jgi:hypothetical protein
LQDDATSVRIATMQAIAQHERLGRSDRLLDALIARLGTPKESHYATFALAQNPSPTALTKLEAAIGKDDDHRRRAALRVLAKHPDAHAEPILLKAGRQIAPTNWAKSFPRSCDRSIAC